MMIGSLRPLCQLVGVFLFATSAAQAAVNRDAEELMSRLAEVGDRSPGTPGHRISQLLLLEALETAGLDDVGRIQPAGSAGWSHLTASLPGRSATEIVLTAHYDTVEDRRGDLDNASGCAAILGAGSELSRVPRRNTTRVVFTDSEEKQATGSREWLSQVPSELRRGMLANLNVDMVGRRHRSGPGIVHITAGWNGDHRVVSPAWLVHAVLRGAAVTGLPVAVLDARWSWLAQLTVRWALPVRVSDSRRFIELGVPSVTVSDLPLTAAEGHHSGPDGDVDAVDLDRLQEWVEVLAGTTRRLDGLADRPIWETEYLVLFGRVWIRRDLVWAGFLLWILLVWRGLPGAWRRRDSMERRRMGRIYLPGFAFRMLFLVAVLLVPSSATLLLYPLAILALGGAKIPPAGRQLLCLLAATPTLVFAVWLAVGQVAGWFVLERAALLPATLVLMTLATFCAWQLDSRSSGAAA